MCLSSDSVCGVLILCVFLYYWRKQWSTELATLCHSLVLCGHHTTEAAARNVEAYKYVNVTMLIVTSTRPSVILSLFMRCLVAHHFFGYIFAWVSSPQIACRRSVEEGVLDIVGVLFLASSCLFGRFASRQWLSCFIHILFTAFCVNGCLDLN